MKFLRFFFSFILFLSCILRPDISLAQEFPSFYEIDNLKADIEINQDGKVFVEKQFSLSLPTSQFAWTLDQPIDGLKIKADNLDLDKNQYQVKKRKDRFVIEVSLASSRPATSFTISYQAEEALVSKKTEDNFHLSLVFQPGVFIKKLEATVSLPSPSDTSKIRQRVYAIHGVEESNFTILDSKTLFYQASFLSSFSSFIIEANFPSGLIKYPFLTRFSFYIESLGFKFWLGIGVILPVLAFLFFFYILYLKKRDERTIRLAYLDKPPEDLPPALVGVLLRENASQREITATILDLAQRGFIDIVKGRNEYVLGKRKGEGALRPFEAPLYDKLFTQQGERKIKRTEFELKKRAAEQLYSPKVSQFYQDLYQEVQNRGYFVKNPALVTLRYRIFGILFFLSAILTSFLAIIYSPGPPFALFGSLGQIFASFLIIKAAPFLTKRTKKGKEALSAWLSFGQFLSDKKSLGLFAAQQGLFEKYLPYAVALGKEIEWANRLKQAAYTPPSWYVADEPTTLEIFVASLFYVTGSLSQILYGLREPSL